MPLTRRSLIKGFIALVSGLIVPEAVAAEPERRIWAFPTNPLSKQAWDYSAYESNWVDMTMPEFDRSNVAVEVHSWENNGPRVGRFSMVKGPNGLWSADIPEDAYAHRVIITTNKLVPCTYSMHTTLTPASAASEGRASLPSRLEMDLRH